MKFSVRMAIDQFMLDKYRQKLKLYLCKRWNVPYNRYGIPNPLFDNVREGQPITLIDIGAHNGSFSASLSQYCSIKRGILIEPLEDKYKLLLDRFRPPVYEVLNCVVSDRMGHVEFEINELSETSSILSIKKDIPEHANLAISVKDRMQCESKTLDSIVKEYELGSIDVLKIDVQGAELLVLHGASGTLAKTRMIWLEVSFKPLYDNSATFFDIYSFMARAKFMFIGMAPVFYSPSGELIQCDALFIHDDKIA